MLTLNPNNLSSPDHFPRDISGTYDVSYTIRTRDTYLRGSAIRYTTVGRRYIPFPENTRGFLYFQKPRLGNPDFSGSLRFRVISEPGPNAFKDGVDLKLPAGGIWQIHLYTALRTVRHAGLVLKLLEEGLVTPRVVEKLRAMPPILLQGTSQILYHLEDPFVARLHAVESLVFMSDEGAESGQIMPLFFDPRKVIARHPYKGMPSYKLPELSVARHKNSLGTMMARFERSTLPEHANTRTIVLRLLESLSPIQCVLKNYDSYISLPTSGELLSGHYERRGNGSLRPWSSNLDTGKGKITRMISLLWPSLSGKDSNT